MASTDCLESTTNVKIPKIVPKGILRQFRPAVIIEKTLYCRRPI